MRLPVSHPAFLNVVLGKESCLMMVSASAPVTTGTRSELWSTRGRYIRSERNEKARIRGPAELLTHPDVRDAVALKHEMPDSSEGASRRRLCEASYSTIADSIRSEA